MTTPLTHDKLADVQRAVETPAATSEQLAMRALKSLYLNLERGIAEEIERDVMAYIEELRKRRDRR
jgi:hypothetical protein